MRMTTCSMSDSRPEAGEVASACLISASQPSANAPAAAPLFRA